MESDFTLFALPFKTNVNNAPENLQMELINLKSDVNLKQKFQDVHLVNFYSYLPIDKYSQVRNFAIRLLALFGSTYKNCICEQIFSQVKNNKSSKRNRLKDKHLQSVMKISHNRYF